MKVLTFIWLVLCSIFFGLFSDGYIGYTIPFFVMFGYNLMEGYYFEAFQEIKKWRHNGRNK